MYIKRIQVEEGFLKDFDVELGPGLDVVIGARGTGKTSLVELVRFCLDVKSYSAELSRKSVEHAKGILRGGRVTVTLVERGTEIRVTRGMSDTRPRASAPFTRPVVFSQTEIEDVGLEPAGRLQLLDSFLPEAPDLLNAETDCITEVRSLMLETGALRDELSQLEAEVAELPEIAKKLASLAEREKGLPRVSKAAQEKSGRLATLSAQLSALSAGTSVASRHGLALAKWRTALEGAMRIAPPAEGWVAQSGFASSEQIERRLADARAAVASGLTALAAAERLLAAAVEQRQSERSELEDRSLALRREVEELQVGATAVAREGQELRDRVAELEALRTMGKERAEALRALIVQRDAALDRLDGIRKTRFERRAKAVADLNRAVGPNIRVKVERAGAPDYFAATLADALKGSGLKYGDLSQSLASAFSPRELVELVEGDDLERLAEDVGIARPRATRVLEQLRAADLGELATVGVEDAVSLFLLDGKDYKAVADLSTGQRCTVVLPLVLRHPDRIVIVDQPEDHIDNAFIVQTLIKAVNGRNPQGQILFTTHNANIPVLGGADLVVHLDSDGERGFVRTAAPLDDPAIVHAISTVMEGGAEAFRRRAKFYATHPADD